VLGIEPNELRLQDGLSIGVDTTRFPEFKDEVKSAMYDEAISTFEYIVRQERPVREILNADYTFLSRSSSSGIEDHRKKLRRLAISQPLSGRSGPLPTASTR
jgi:hypothetical protein